MKTHDSRKAQLLKYFREISGSKTIAGLTVYKLGVNEKHQQIFHNISGEYPGVIRTYLPQTSDSVLAWRTFVNETISTWNKGQLVMIYWDNFSPLALMDMFVNTSDTVDTKTRWLQLIEDGTTLNKEWKKQLDILAPYLQKLQNAGVVPILDIFNAMNNKKFIWRGRPGVNGTAKLYKITHDYLTKRHKLTSLIWTWSLYHGDIITLLGEFWPGAEYVDVASAEMGYKKELSIKEYQRFLDVVGDKPIFMDWMFTVPTPELLAAQPNWTWFTLYDKTLKNETYNDANKIKRTFNSASVIYKGDIDFFSDPN